MRQVSHSEISTYLDCQKKWELQYIKGLRIDNIHFQFGSMGHSVLETRTIPSEELYPELKEHFEISSWRDYFTPIFEELDERFKDYEVLYREYKVETDEIKGIIDVVWKNKNTGRYLITDYKFSTSDKGQEDILLDEQMYIYSVIFALKNGLNLDEIDMGYINIPKTELNKPRLLKNGKLSKDKAQRTTYKMYLKAIRDNNLDINEYADILSELSERTLLNVAIAPINTDMAMRIMTNIDNTIKDMEKGYVLEKCSFLCKKCDYLQYCKYGKAVP